MPKQDPNSPGSRERQAAQAILEKVESLSKGSGEIREEVTRIAKALDGVQARFEGVDDALDVAATLRLVEEHRAAIEEIREAVRRSKTGHYFPGIEDAGKKFSLLKTAIAVRSGGTKEAFERAGAGHEFEVIHEAKQAATKVAGHVIGVDSSAGTFVPDQVLPDVIQAIYSRSVFANVAGDGQTRATVLDGLFGIPVKIPRLFRGMAAYWIGEEDEYVASKIRSGVTTMTPKKLGVFAGVTDEMRRFPAPAFETMMRTDFVRAAAEKIDWTIMYGTGTDNMPRGISNMPAYGNFAVDYDGGVDSAGNLVPGVQRYWTQTGTPSWSATAAPSSPGADFDFDFDDFMEMQGILEDNDIPMDGSFAWITHPRVWRRAKRLKVQAFSGQTSGFAYLLGAPMISNTRLADLIGPFGATTQIPTTKNPGGSATAKYADLFAGNLGELLFGRWSGIEIEDDDGRGAGFSRDITYVKLRMYADVGTREERALIYCPDVRARD